MITIFIITDNVRHWAEDFGHDKPDYKFCPYCGAEWK